MRVAAAVDDLHDTVEDLDPVIQACGTVDELRRASDKYPAAFDGIDPVVFVQNRCSSRSVNGTLCDLVAPSIGNEALEDLAAAVCANTTYDRCEASVLQAAAFGSGSIVAVCEFGDGTGDVVLLDNEDAAEEECSGGGLISPSRVVDVITIP